MNCDLPREEYFNGCVNLQFTNVVSLNVVVSMNSKELFPMTVKVPVIV